MSESDMPGRIWAEGDNVYHDQPADGRDPYVRADLADAVAEAAENVTQEFAQQHPLIKSLRAALSAYREGLKDG